LEPKIAIPVIFFRLCYSQSSKTYNNCCSVYVSDYVVAGDWQPQGHKQSLRPATESTLSLNLNEQFGQSFYYSSLNAFISAIAAPPLKLQAARGQGRLQKEFYSHFRMPAFAEHPEERFFRSGRFGISGVDERRPSDQWNPSTNGWSPEEELVF